MQVYYSFMRITNSSVGKKGFSVIICVGNGVRSHHSSYQPEVGIHSRHTTSPICACVWTVLSLAPPVIPAIHA